MSNQARLKMLIATVIKTALKEVNFPAFYEVIKDSDSFLASGHAHKLDASFCKGMPNEGTVKLQPPSGTKSPCLAFFLPSRLMHRAHLDRKSTRLNSSHVKISYA